MRANCELTLPTERQIIISGIGLGLRFFYLMNFFTQSDPPQPPIRDKSPPGAQRQLGGGDLTLIAGWRGSLCVQNSCTRDRFCDLGSARNSRAVSLGKGKPRDLNYPVCWTGARRCGAEISRAALSASPPKCKNGGTAGFEPPHISLLRLLRICFPIRPPISSLAMRQHFIWIWSLREFVFKKKCSPASAGKLRMLRTHRRGLYMLSGDPRG